jgi:L-lactate dehydrogenase
MPGGIFQQSRSISCEKTASSLIDGYYGIGDVCMSLPVVLSQNGIQRQLFMELSDQEVAMFHYSAKKLKEVIEQLDEV